MGAAIDQKLDALAQTTFENRGLGKEGFRIVPTGNQGNDSSDSLSSDSLQVTS